MDLYITLPIVALVIIILKLISKPLTLRIISKELTQSMSMKIPVNGINFIFLALTPLLSLSVSKYGHAPHGRASYYPRRRRSQYFPYFFSLRVYVLLF